MLGVAGGAAPGLIILAFERAIREMSLLWGDTGDGFEGLPMWMLLLLPTLGAITLGALCALLAPADRETGIVRVLSRMHSHCGALPLRNAVLQCVGGTFSLATGQSGGRKGPGMHPGGAIYSFFGQWLRLPNNSLRTLIACGTAGGIAAAFNTPLAAVLFAMEVIVAEYTVISFIPVLLPAVSASAVSHSLASGASLFELPALQLNSLLEFPYLILLGLCCGISAFLFIRISSLCARLSDDPIVLRFSAAGLVTGCLALAVPEILGVGDDTLERALQGKLALWTLVSIVLCKLFSRAVSIRAGMPVGIIGPSLLIGACLGAVLGEVGFALQPELASDPPLYAVIGMGAAMAAILNAPLAAVLAIVEMTQHLNISMAAMLAIVTATLTNIGLFGQRSAHQTLLHQLQRTVPQEPLNQMLHRINVRATMDSRVVRVPVLLQRRGMHPLLERRPTWCLVAQDGTDLSLISGKELLQCLDQFSGKSEAFDLTSAPIRRWTVAHVPIQATLHQAMDTMRDNAVEAVYGYARSPRTGKRILHGINTREAVETFAWSQMLREDS
ncbi:MAG: chloride channel protein [Halioglobus sp.]|nr:chloride channel protein [Halioglobus sp.]